MNLFAEGIAQFNQSEPIVSGQTAIMCVIELRQ